MTGVRRCGTASRSQRTDQLASQAPLLSTTREPCKKMRCVTEITGFEIAAPMASSDTGAADGGRGAAPPQGDDKGCNSSCGGNARERHLKQAFWQPRHEVQRRQAGSHNHQLASLLLLQAVNSDMMGSTSRLCTPCKALPAP